MELLTYRAATREDVSYLLDLRTATMTPHENALGIARTPDEVLRRVLLALEQAKVILCEGVPIGLLKVVRDDSKWQLLQLQIAPTHQRSGIGSRVVRDLLAEARTARASLHLHVLRSNPARSLYERLGFVTVGENDHSLEMATEV